MTNFVPIFPLAIVMYPGEEMNLHIFEDRYRQLITECYADAKPFGLPVVLNNKMTETGTLVQITEIVEVYADGRLDIRIKGLSVFRILEVLKSIPDKLYSGAIVNYPDNIEVRNPLKTQRILAYIRRLHLLLKIEKNFKKPDDALTSYDMAHHAGLSLEEEHELLGLLQENQRLEYLKRHLNKIIPVVDGTELLKEKIKLNGHFKELKGFNLDL